MALKSWNIPNFISKTDLASADWAASGSGTNEYYYTGSALDGEPPNVLLNGEKRSKGTIGSLAAGEWGWGDNDSIGSSTLYVRLDDGSDPSTHEDGYIQTSEVIQSQMLLDSTGVTVILLSLIVSNYSSLNDANVVIERRASDDTMKFRWAMKLKATDSPLGLDNKMVYVGGDKLVVESDLPEVSVEASGDES